MNVLHKDSVDAISINNLFALQTIFVSNGKHIVNRRRNILIKNLFARRLNYNYINDSVENYSSCSIGCRVE